MAPVISPQEALLSYDPLVRYLGRKLNRPVELVQRRTYAEVNNLVRTGEVEIAFVCGGAYVIGQREFGMSLLAAPQVNGTPTYYSFLIVRSGSQARRLEDLRGKSFAFSDPMSNSGRAAPTWALSRIGEQPRSFFSRTIFTYSHSNSIRAVADGLVDGAAVDNLVYEDLAATEPGVVAKVKVIARWGPFGIPPVVSGPAISRSDRLAFQRVLKAMSADAEGREILARLRIERFVSVPDSLYDGVRRMVLEVGLIDAG